MGDFRFVHRLGFIFREFEGVDYVTVLVVRILEGTANPTTALQKSNSFLFFMHKAHKQAQTSLTNFVHLLY